MASETTMPPVNGSYGAPPQYNAAELPAHSTPSNAGANGANGQNQAGSAANSDHSTETPSKDEVGWYFVEQYYTTMSKSPDKLPLFYSKKSQFVSGVEDEKVAVSIGQKAIGERIKEIAIEDCKVRVTNVDSQESQDKSIVIQVIGEMWMKSEPHRKFVQTFVLAKQHNGYYVLNDILRYLADEDAEEEEAAPEAEAATTAESEEAPPLHTLPSTDNLAEQEKAAESVDKLLEKSAGEEPSVVAASAAAPAAEAAPEEPTPETEPEPSVEEEITVEEVIVPEVPKDPEPTPAPPSPKVEEPKPAAAAQEPAAPSKPSAPKTWASMLAGPQAAKAVTPAVPVTPAQPKKAPAAAPAQVATAPAATATAAEDAQPLPSPGGWQTAGQEHNKKQNRQQSNSVSQGADSNKVLGYIKNVTERVDNNNLKNALTKYGKLDYFDISRQKNCAFVEFADRAGFEAAVAANPHNVDGEAIYVEERRPRPNAYGGQYNNRGGMRGGRGGMENRPPSQGGRGGFQKDGRGGSYTPRGGRGNMTPRGGRGMPQTA